MNPDTPPGNETTRSRRVVGPEIEALNLSISLSGRSKPPPSAELVSSWRDQPDLLRDRTPTSDRATPAATPLHLSQLKWLKSHLPSGFIRRRELRERKRRPGLSNAWLELSPGSSGHAAKSLTIRVKHSGHESDCGRLIRVLLRELYQKLKCPCEDREEDPISARAPFS